MTPKRSARRPMRMPPMPKPIISERVGQRSVGARDAELGLHRRQHDGHDVHAARADRHQRERDEETPGRVG